jgi:hypothetical protein
MGMDVCSESGIVFRATEILPKLFNKINKQQLENVGKKILETGLDQPKLKNGKDLVKWFVDNGQTEDNETINSILEFCIAELGLDLPLVEFRMWESSRMSGWQVPAGELCVVFNHHKIFETKLTPYGQKVAKQLGQKSLDLSTWTWVSC